MLRAFFRFFAALLLLVLVLALPASLALRNMSNLLFEAESTKELVRETLMNSDIAGRLARRGAEQMLRAQVSASVVVEVFEELDEQEWKAITEVIAPEYLVSDALDGAVDSFSEWLNNPDPAAELPELHVSLAAWKTSTVQRAGEVTTLIFDSLPDCTMAHVSEMLQLSIQNPVALTENLPACRPPEPLYSTFVDQSGRLLGQMANLAPDTIDLDQLIEDSQTPRQLAQLKQDLLLARTWLNWGWAIVLGLMALAAIVAASDWKSFLAWFGVPLLLAGLLMVALGFIFLLFNLGFVTELVADTGANAAVVRTLAAALADGALRRVSGPLLLQGVLVALAGSGVSLWARSLYERAASPGIPIRRRRLGL